jgi:hypothetical protein
VLKHIGVVSSSNSVDFTLEPFDLLFQHLNLTILPHQLTFQLLLAFLVRFRFLVGILSLLCQLLLLLLDDVFEFKGHLLQLSNSFILLLKFLLYTF